MKAIAVIGMNYGDEGKGHMVNYFSDNKTLNVRFNGGAQAAHAVFLADGRNHIFHHFGSGSLRGARTLLASHFIVNPLIFAKELYELSAKTPMREVFIDPRCRVTTPFDMAINEFSARHHGKTGTCGIGINETVERSAYRQLKINAKLFFESSDEELRGILMLIKNEYVPHRAEVLGLPADEFNRFYENSFPAGTDVDTFLKIRKWMANKTAVMWPDDKLIDAFLAKEPGRKVVFEGAQGMLLDQSRKEFFPYLTRSSTGPKNIKELLSTVKNVSDVEFVLVTRAYLTRHGDGPIMNKVDNPYGMVENTTNPYNEFQGSMRYGYLSGEWFGKALLEVDGAKVAVTCMDHTEGRVKIGDSYVSPAEINRAAYFSYGPLDTDIREAKK